MIRSMLAVMAIAMLAAVTQAGTTYVLKDGFVQAEQSSDAVPELTTPVSQVCENGVCRLVSVPSYASTESSTFESVKTTATCQADATSRVRSFIDRFKERPRLFTGRIVQRIRDFRNVTSR